MSFEMRTEKIRITPTHPDFTAAAEQAWQARRYSNTLNFIAKAMFDQRAKNYEYNKTCTDPAKLIENPYTYLEPLYDDTRLKTIPGVVDWIRKHPTCNFEHKFNFADLAKLVYLHLGISLNMKVVQAVGMKLAESWKSYAVLQDLFYADPETNHKPSPPGYKRKYGYVEYNKQAVSKGQQSFEKQRRITQVIPTGWKVGVMLPAHLKLSDLRSVRLIPLHDKAFDLEVVYQIQVPDLAHDGLATNEVLAKLLKRDTLPLIAATDLGQDVLGAFVFSDGRTPILVNGKPLKAINAYANKGNSKLKSAHDMERENVHKKNMLMAYQNETPVRPYPHPLASQALDRLWVNRNDRINLYLHTASSRVISMLVNAKVEVLIIGWNKGFKNKINLGRKNNQTFTQIPHARFRDQLIYKARAAGITVIVAEESYTSKASFLDGDYIPTYGNEDAVGWKPSGRRVERGMYKSAGGILIHADVNAAYNILAKHVVRVSLTKVMSNKGVVVHPVWLKMPGLNHKPDTVNPQTLVTEVLINTK